MPLMTQGLDPTAVSKRWHAAQKLLKQPCTEQLPETDPVTGENVAWRIDGQFLSSENSHSRQFDMFSRGSKPKDFFLPQFEKS